MAHPRVFFEALGAGRSFVRGRRAGLVFVVDGGFVCFAGTLARTTVFLRGTVLRAILPVGSAPAKRSFWAGCDAIAGRDEWQIWGTPNCGKGQPLQVAHVGHGASPARFRNVQVGVLK